MICNRCGEEGRHSLEENNTDLTQVGMYGLPYFLHVSCFPSGGVHSGLLIVEPLVPPGAQRWGRAGDTLPYTQQWK